MFRNRVKFWLLMIVNNNREETQPAIDLEIRVPMLTTKTLMEDLIQRRAANNSPRKAPETLAMK